MKLLINIIAIIVVAVVIGFQFNNKTKSILSKRAAIMAALKYYQLLIISY